MTNLPYLHIKFFWAVECSRDVGNNFEPWVANREILEDLRGNENLCRPITLPFSKSKVCKVGLMLLALNMSVFPGMWD